ncbi:recombinase family protein [Chloroflexota bacterium]
MITAAAYARVSSDEQAKGGTSLDTQVVQELTKAQQLGWQVPETYIIKEDWTGKDLNRPGLSKLMNLASQHLISGVIFFTLDRLYRPDQPGDEWRVFEVLQRFQDNGVKVEWVDHALSMREGPFSGLMMFLDSWRAGEERRKIVERTIRGKRARASQGRIPQGTGKGIFGYYYDIKTKTRHINEEQAVTIRRLFEWAIQGFSFHGMAKKLNGEGVPTLTGKRWHPLTIRRILSNSVYAGLGYYGKTQRVTGADGKSHAKEQPKSQWVEIRGATPAIISMETYNSAQIANQGVKRREFSRPRKNLLSGHVYCGTCGSRLTGSVQQQKYAYYYCRNNWQRYGHTCTQRYVRAEELEEASWQSLRDVLANPELVMSELIKNQSRSLPFIDEEEASLQRNIKLLVDQEKRLVRLYALGEVDEAFIIQDSRSLKVRRGAAESRLNEITNQRLQLANLHDDQSKVSEVCRTVSANLNNMTFENKRLAIEALRAQVWVFQDRVEVRGYLPTSSLTIARTSA